MLSVMTDSPTDAYVAAAIKGDRVELAMNGRGRSVWDASLALVSSLIVSMASDSVEAGEDVLHDKDKFEKFLKSISEGVQTYTRDLLHASVEAAVRTTLEIRGLNKVDGNYIHDLLARFSDFLDD